MNMKKYWFYKNEVCFLDCIMLTQDIKIEDKKNEIVKNWLEPKSVWNIQVFINFANFYWRYIQDFSKIAVPFILILKTTKSLDLALRILEVDDHELIRSGDKIDEIIRNLSKSKISKMQSPKFWRISIRATGKSTFLTLGAKKAFNQLK